MNSEHAELEQWMRRFDDPQPTPQTMDAVRRTVRVALDEGWLARAEDPAPSPDAMERVRETVRRELVGGRALILPAAYRRSPAFGGLAAAAAIIAAVAVGWVSSLLAPAPVAPPDALVAFELALDDAGDAVDEQLALIAADLSSLEAEWSDTSSGFDDDGAWIVQEIERASDGSGVAGGDS